MMAEQIQQGHAFLDFVATHEVELKRIMSKEISQDVNEIYQDAVLKVYSAILRGSKVSNFKGYFLHACKMEQISRKRKAAKKKEDPDSLWLETNDVTQDMPQMALQRENRDAALREVLEIVACCYGEEIAALYVLNKTCGRKWCYKRIGSEAEVNSRIVSSILRKVDNFIKTDHRIAGIRRRLKQHADDN